MHLRRVCFLIALAANVFSALRSQAPPSQLPSDPLALMSLAHDKNGLEGSGIRPWHVHGTYHLIAKNGQLEDAGIYEEWWISPSKYKRMFVGKSFAQIEYADGQGLFRAGSQDWPPGVEMLLRGAMIEPLPDPLQLKEFQLVRQSLPPIQDALECVAMTHPVRAGLKVTGDFFPTACFDSKLPVLRIYSGGASYRATFDSFTVFQGHYLAKQIHVYAAGDLLGELTIDRIESLEDASDAVVTPPAEAKPVDLSVIAFKEGSTRYYPGLLKKAVPVYPELAKKSHIQGTVVLQGTVGTDGRPTNLKAISGPPLLYPAAIDAVGQWIYRPFVVMGEPRTVQMEFKIIFSLG